MWNIIIYCIYLLYCIIQDIQVKRTVSWDFCTFFGQTALFGPIINGQNGFAKFFGFMKIFAKKMCWVDYASGHRRQTWPLTDFKGSAKKSIGVCSHTYLTALFWQVENRPFPAAKIACPDYTDMQISYFVIEYLRENGNARGTVSESIKLYRSKIWWYCLFKTEF